jgi:hypothetical protein
VLASGKCLAERAKVVGTAVGQCRTAVGAHQNPRPYRNGAIAGTMMVSTRFWRRSAWMVEPGSFSLTSVDATTTRRW